MSAAIEPSHPMVTTALRRLHDFIETLADELIPQTENPVVAATYRASLVGVLCAGLQATYRTKQANIIGLVLSATQSTFSEDPAAQLLLAGLADVGPQNVEATGIPSPDNLDVMTVAAGVTVAIKAIQALPQPVKNDVMLSQQMGALVGFLQGILYAGGFDNSVHVAQAVGTRIASRFTDGSMLASLDFNPETAN